MSVCEGFPGGWKGVSLARSHRHGVLLSWGVDLALHPPPPHTQGTSNRNSGGGDGGGCCRWGQCVCEGEE